MAEANFNEFVAGAGVSRSGSVGRLMNIAGALASIALVIGVAVWGYRLAVRDALGVPVIRAMQGPMRVPSDERGSMVTAHLGLSVNRIAAEGAAGEVPERIVLAEPPIDLDPEDAAGVGARAPDPAPVAALEDDTLARTLALAEELARQAAAEMEPVEPALMPAEAALPLPAGAIQRSIRPMPRPARAAGLGAAAAISGAVPVAVSAITPLEVAPNDLPAGTRLAQIGAFDDADTARGEWDRVAELHPGLFEGKTRVIQPANSVGRTFYRLRVAGFTTEDDSRRFCRAVEAGDLRCIPVTTR